MSKTADMLSPERNLQVAYEAVLSRISTAIFSDIDPDRLLEAAATEVAKITGADCCQIAMLEPDGKLRITHEYCAGEGASGLGLQLQLDASRIQNATVIDDAAAPTWPDPIRELARIARSKSILLVPMVFQSSLLGLFALHRGARGWSNDEMNFLKGLAQQIAIGYRYAQIYTEKEKEVHINKVLLEIANDINTGSDFSEVIARILDRSLELLRAQAACLAVLDTNEGAIHFTNLHTAGLSSDILKLDSLKIPSQQMLPRRVERGQMIKMLSPDQNEMARFFLTQVISAGSALIVPMVVEEKLFGGLVVLWKEPRSSFGNEEISLALGITDQLAIALSKDRLSAEVLRLRRELDALRSSEGGPAFVGKSENIMRCLQMALYVAASNTTVLLQGESGTGKEMLADLIQSRSPRANKPYIKINCGAIPEALLESELFGHEKGAFTDAYQRRIGRFEEANGGTLFLDEIGEMSLAAQVRLLRVLQNGQFTRVGGNEVVKVDVRVIAASNVDLEEAVREGRFRRDLFYRLNVYPIKLPPLRERPEDIPLLALHFLEIYKKRSNKRITGITDKALALLARYDWPGNVRELENAIERAVILAQSRMITADDLPDAVRGSESESTDRKVIQVEIGTTIDEVEKRLILETLAHTCGDKSKTAQLLGIGRKTLYRKLQQYQKEAPK
jgi:two-component system response regulator HydG